MTLGRICSASSRCPESTSCAERRSVFGLGAVIGLGSFVTLLQWLLEHHRRTLMVVVPGVLVGALRALWPWQDDARGLEVPDPGWAAMLVPVLLGAALVVGIMLLERRLEGLPAPAPAAGGPDDRPTPRAPYAPADPRVGGERDPGQDAPRR